MSIDYEMGENKTAMPGKCPSKVSDNFDQPGVPRKIATMTQFGYSGDTGTGLDMSGNPTVNTKPWNGEGMGGGPEYAPDWAYQVEPKHKNTNGADPFAGKGSM